MALIFQLSPLISDSGFLLLRPIRIGATKKRLEGIHFKIRQQWNYDLRMARLMVFPCGQAPVGYPEACQCLTWLSTSIICNWQKYVQYSIVATRCWAPEIWIKYGWEFWIFMLIVKCSEATHMVSTVKVQFLNGWGRDCTHPTVYCLLSFLQILYVFLLILTSSLLALFACPLFIY